MDDYVEAIENGRIVKVDKEYAKKEGLVILRKPINIDNNSEVRAMKSAGAGFVKEGLKRRKPMFEIDKYRRPLNYKENNVVSDLNDNFHWELTRARKQKNFTRRQASRELGIDEETLKMVENGILPKDDYVLINKLQSYYGVNLRKDGKSFRAPELKSEVVQNADSDSREGDSNKGSDDEELFGNEIEVEEK